MKKLQINILLVAVCMCYLFGANAQTRNLYVEGSDYQIGVIHTTSSGSSYSDIELLRSSEFSGRNWRLLNDVGLFKLSTGINNTTH